VDVLTGRRARWALAPNLVDSEAATPAPPSTSTIRVTDTLQPKGARKEAGMGRASMSLTLATSTFGVLFLGGRLFAHGAALIPLVGILFGALAIGATLGAWMTRRELRGTRTGSRMI
jgi:hypothetical protein